MTHTGLELAQLRVFIAVADARGFGRAARGLGVAQSTVSEALASLERALGVTLLTRTNRPVTLTPAGEALLPHAKLLLRNADAALAEVAAVTEQLRTTVRLGAPESVGAHLLPEAVAAVRSRWPATRFHIEAAPCAEIRSAVAGGRLEVGLVVEPASADRAGAELLREVSLAIFGRRGHPLAGREVGPGELWEYAFVLSEAAGHYHAVLRSFFETGGYALPAFEVGGSVEAVRRLVLSGDALGALPDFAVRADVEDGRVAVIAPVPRLEPLELRMVHTPGGVPSPMAEMLSEVLRTQPLTDRP